jgi:transcriptional regulator with AAA-type ATPase domain
MKQLRILWLKFRWHYHRKQMERSLLHTLEHGNVRQLREAAEFMRIIARDYDLQIWADLADTVDANAERTVLARINQ